MTVMEISQSIRATHHPSPSPDGKHIALVNSSRFEIRSSSTLELVRSTAITLTSCTLRWAPTDNRSVFSSRILLANEESVRVFDLYDTKWTATISNGSSGMGKLVNVEFGRNGDEVLCFSDFGSKMTVWQLASGRSVELRDPKFCTRGHAFRPITNVFALLSRPAAQDILTLHAPGSFFAVKKVVLPSIDAQGLKWSPDKRWIALWETASVGVQIYIFTADGNLYRIYKGDSSDEMLGLGVRSVEWSPKGDYLAVGGHDRRLTLLSTRTFSPMVHLDHSPRIDLGSSSQVWQESISPCSTRTYERVAAPVALPMAPDSPTHQHRKAGLSIITFNAEGTMLATRDESAPTTVWLWNVRNLSATAALIQHSPVKALIWHPTLSNLLLIQCTHEEPTLYFYDVGSAAPCALPIALQRPGTGRLEMKWLFTGTEEKPALVIGDMSNFVVVWPDGRDSILRFPQSKRIEAEESEEEDSLFAILTGKSPTRVDDGDVRMDTTGLLVGEVLEETTVVLDDTFVGRKHSGIT